MELHALDPQIAILLEVSLAMLLGGLIGVERELADKPAGFRTHMLVAGAAALFVGVGNLMAETFVAPGDGQTVRMDPNRIIEAIVPGISFLGAGTIFRRKESRDVEGLTTAASILFSSAIGICAALRHFTLAIGATILALVVLWGLRFVGRWIDSVRDKSEGRAR